MKANLQLTMPSSHVVPANYTLELYLPAQKLLHILIVTHVIVDLASQSFFYSACNSTCKSTAQFSL